jgi:osmotically-inducible protein OsmY
MEAADALTQEQAMTNTQPRLDSDVFAEARKALDDDPSVPQDVRVHVDRGTVTLTGTVRWPREKSQAEAVVRQIVGVLGVVNHITVAQVVNPEGFDAPESR